jgi:hypothetical protein
MIYNKADTLLDMTVSLQLLSLQPSGDLFETIREFYYLLRQQDSNVFIELYDRSKTNEGKMYAVIGLYLLEDVEEYSKFKNEMKNKTICLETGDVISSEKASYIFDLLEEGRLQRLLFWRIDTDTWEIIKNDGNRKKIFS